MKDLISFVKKESRFHAFDAIRIGLASPELIRSWSFGEVRKRLAPFDTTTASPLLGRYGDPEGREYKQYFLYDDNEPPPACPFHRLAQTKLPSVEDKEQAA